MKDLTREFSDFLCEKIRTSDSSADSLKSLLIFILTEYNFNYLFLQRIYSLYTQTKR